MNRNEAEEHLRVIRSLMEKATIYRALSAPTALAGGLASVLFGGWQLAWWHPLPRGRGEELLGCWFLVGWAAVLTVTGLVNACFLLRDARRRNDSFISSGMRHALMAMFPALLTGAVMSMIFISWNRQFWLPPVWMLCYGLALLATKGFAPRSIQWLGWAFLAAGLVSAFALPRLGCQAWWGNAAAHQPTVANFVMVATFGLFHLIYAACTWPRSGAKAGGN